MAITIPTLAQIVARVKDDINTRLGSQAAFLRRSLAWALAHALPGAVWGLYEYGDWIAAQALPDTADTEQLDRWGRIWGVSRNAATKATGTIEVDGIAGSTLPDGARLSHEGGQEYEVTGGDVVWASTTTETVTVQAVVAGADGNLASGGSPAAYLTISSPPSGIASECPLATDIAGGADAESDASLRARILARIQDAPQGGSKADYEAWTQATPGVDVARVWIFDWTDRGDADENEVTVRFTVEGTGTAVIPSGGEVTLVEDYVTDRSRRPVTADVDVAGVTGHAVTLEITDLVIDDGADLATVRAAVLAELQSMFVEKTEIDPTAGVIPNSYLHEAISGTAGVDSYELTAVDGLAGTADIDLGAYEYPTLIAAGITWA